LSAAPSIKGSVFAAVVEDVAKLLETGDLSKSEAARWLQPADVKLLDAQISVSSWYDLRVYTRMCTLLRDVVGEGDDQFLRDRGRETARRLLEAGFYAQLEFLHHIEAIEVKDPEERFKAFGRDLRKLCTLSRSILNFSRWTSAHDPDEPTRYRIDVAEAEEFPDVLCWRSDGFINEMATHHGHDDLWGWERVASDRIVFRMLRSI
jgi:hypothetical protein